MFALSSYSGGSPALCCVCHTWWGVIADTTAVHTWEVDSRMPPYTVDFDHTFATFMVHAGLIYGWVFCYLVFLLLIS